VLEVSVGLRNIEVMVVTTQLNGGYLRVYGPPRPSSPEVAVTTQVLYAECRFGSPAFANPLNGTAAANTIAPETNVPVTGVPIWFRAFAADGVTAVLDGDMVEDLVPSQAELAQGGSFSVLSLLYSRP
jgi:hypothetical protein